jgi:hypothetical protein
MRLPNTPDYQPKTHYLTDFYVDYFKLKTIPFNNADDNAFLKFYNMEPITIDGMK